MGAVTQSALAAACEQLAGRISTHGSADLPHAACFHIQKDRFCLQSEQWEGHATDMGDGHPFVSLFDLLMSTPGRGGKRPGAGPKPKVDADAVAALRAKKRTWAEVEAEMGISRWSAMKALKRARSV